MSLSCKDCEFHKSCVTNLMSGSGDRKADVMLVGDCPTKADDEQGDPYIGDTGSKLDYLLEQAKIKRKEIWITNAIKCFPNTPAAIRPVHINACRKHVFAEILKVRPKVIIALGNRAMASLLDEKSTKSFRGHFFQLKIAYMKGDKKKVFKVWVMPSYSPVACLAKWEFDKLVIHDLKKAKKYADTGELPKKLKLKYDLVTSLKGLRRATKELTRAKEFSFDFETTGLSFNGCEIITAGFCHTPGEVFIIPYFEYDIELHSKKWESDDIDLAKKINKFVRENKPKIQLALKEILKSKAAKIAQNGKFDVKFARYNKFPVNNFSFDTIIGHALVDENSYHDLSYLLEWYGINHLGEEYGPYENDLWPHVNKTRKNKKPYSFAPPSLLADYLAKDCDGTLRLKPLIQKQIKREKLWKLFTKQQMPLVKVLADMEYRGIKLEISGFQKIAKRFNSRLAELGNKITKITKNKEFNPASHIQVRNYFESINTPLTKLTKSRENYSTDAKVLVGLSKSKRKYGLFARTLIDHREIKKLKSTYLDGTDGQSGMLSHTDSRGFVHTYYNAHTPRTGRLSSIAPNLQNIPRPNPKYPWVNIRQFFVPSKPNKKLFSIDFKQLEMRIAAYLSKDRVMLKEIRSGVDIHSRNAVMFGTKLGFLPAEMTEKKFIKIIKYKIPDDYEELSKSDKLRVDLKVRLCAEYIEIRVFAKTLGFGLNYGMEASTLAEDFDMEIDEVQAMIDLYFDKYSDLDMYRETIKEEALTKGYLRLPVTGRKRRFYGAVNWFNSVHSSEYWKKKQQIGDVERQAINFPIQGFANEIFTQGKLKFYNALKKEKLTARIMLSLHDGLLGEAPLSEFKRIHELAVEHMEITLGKGKKNEVYLGIDFEAYESWTGKKIEIYT